DLYRQFETIARERLEVAGVIVGGVGVELGAVDGKGTGNLPHLVPLRALEHHVFQEVRSAGDPGVLVARANLVVDLEADDRGRVHLLRQDFQAVRQNRLADADGGNPGGRRPRGRKEPGKNDSWLR